MKNGLIKVPILLLMENSDIAKDKKISLSFALNTIIQIQQSLKEDISQEEKDEIINKIKSIQNSVKK